MNMRDLEYASALAETLHFGEAARRCHVSQSTLSIQIKKLEGELHAQLFERDAKAVRLSEAGVALLPHIRQVLGNAAALTQHAATLRDPLAGTVRMGVFPTLAPYVLPHFMPALSKNLPQLRFELIEEKTELLVARLLAGELDVALLALPIDAPRLDAIALFAEPFHLAVDAGNPLAQRTKLKLDDIAKTPLLLLDEGHCLREQSLALCARIGIGESQAYRATSLETLRHMVASGAGATLMPALAARANDGIHYLPLADSRAERQIALVFRSATVRRVLFMRLAHEIRAALRAVKPLKLLAASGSRRHN